MQSDKECLLVMLKTGTSWNYDRILVFEAVHADSKQVRAHARVCVCGATNRRETVAFQLRTFVTLSWRLRRWLLGRIANEQHARVGGI